MEPIQFEATIEKVQSVAQGGYRVTLDFPDPVAGVRLLSLTNAQQTVLVSIDAGENQDKNYMDNAENVP